VLGFWPGVPGAVGGCLGDDVGPADACRLWRVRV
jgi:hypothetical protein